MSIISAPGASSTTSTKPGKASRKATRRAAKTVSKTVDKSGGKGSDKAAKEKRHRSLRPGPRGWWQPAAGGVGVVESPPLWRGTTVQVCGLWPWAAGSGSPVIGAPMGTNLLTGGMVCCDPISWFQRAKLISSPSVFVLGKVGLGKSTVVRRMLLGLDGFGVTGLVLGDTKPDHAALVAAMGGQVFRLGRGRGHINPLDRTMELQAAAELQGAGMDSAAREVLADAHGRRVTMVLSLLAIARKGPATDREENIISRGVELLDERGHEQPVLRDLLAVVREAPAELREVALDRGSMDRYREVTEALEASLVGLASGRGRLGDLFSERTSFRVPLDKPVDFDISSIDESDTDLLAAASLICWATGIGAVGVSNTLSDAGLRPQRNYFIVLDEFWKTLGAAPGLVKLVDSLIRLLRTWGVGVAMISHTLADLEAIADETDRKKAMGFVERSGMVISGGVPRAEMPRLRQVIDFSKAEADLLASWSSPAAWDLQSGRPADPPGLGNFLVKVGGRPGIPFHVSLTESERQVNDTNQRWHKQ